MIFNLFLLPRLYGCVYVCSQSIDKKKPVSGIWTLVPICSWDWAKEQWQSGLLGVNFCYNTVYWKFTQECVIKLIKMPYYSIKECVKCLSYDHYLPLIIFQVQEFSFALYTTLIATLN